MDKPRMDRIGYDAEEAYFNRLNHENARKFRERLDGDRATVTAQQSGLEHWLRCPKCGGDMEEVSVRDVKVDECRSCHGIYFDAGELELLVRSEDPEQLNSLRSRLH